MKTYIYDEPIFYEGGAVGNREVKITNKDILIQYWDHWKSRMENKYGKDHELITEENCIEDWVTVHWAWETK